LSLLQEILRLPEPWKSHLQAEYLEILRDVGWTHCSLQVYKRKDELLWAALSLNTIALEGEESLLRAFYRGESQPIRFYVGLTSANLNRNSSVAQAASFEPTALADGVNTKATGYARAVLSRNALAWPTLGEVSIGGVMHKSLVSQQFVFKNEEPEEGGLSWPVVSKSFVVARISDGPPVVERLVQFTDLDRPPHTFRPKDSMTVTVEAIFGTKVG
jgi:hypothetical protein